jgi:hypothetical protein
MRRSDGGFQPYAAREPGPALDAMQGGKPFFLPNPMDAQRGLQRSQRRGGNALSEAIRRQRELPVPPEVF